MDRCKIGTHYLVLLLFLTTCDCQYQNKVEVFNYSNQNITLRYKLLVKDSLVQIIKPRESAILLSGAGGWCSCMNCKGEQIRSADSSMSWLFSSIEIFKLDTIPTKTNYNKEKNWQYISQKSQSYFKATVSESDFK